MADALPLPKYHQIYLVLREQLHEGRFAQGLPGELALMRQFGVARVTVRRALQELADEGLIAREPGRGTRPVTAAAPKNGRGGAVRRVEAGGPSGQPHLVVQPSAQRAVRRHHVDQTEKTG